MHISVISSLADQPNNLYILQLESDNKMAPPSVTTADAGSDNTAKDSTQLEDDTARSACQTTITSVEVGDTSSTCPTIISSPNDIQKQITKGVVRAKLSKRRHLVIPAAISPAYLDTLMPEIVTNLFQPQTVKYNGGVANITNWKISCYLEVMDGGIPWKVLFHLACIFICLFLQTSCTNKSYHHLFRHHNRDNAHLPVLTHILD